MNYEAAAFAIGILLVSGVGFFHHCGLLGLRRLTPDVRERPYLSIIALFTGLLSLHLIEIGIFAAVYRILLSIGQFGAFAGLDEPGWVDLLYFSGINFATLGYTQIETLGPLRLVHMLESLGGFMIITWSATFIYAVWGDGWRQD